MINFFKKLIKKQLINFLLKRDLVILDKNPLSNLVSNNNFLSTMFCPENCYILMFKIPSNLWTRCKMQNYCYYKEKKYKPIFSKLHLKSIINIQ